MGTQYSVKPSIRFIMEMRLIVTFLLLASIQFCQVLSLDCLTCKANPNKPLKCTRPEHDGTYKTCDKGTTACFKTVDRKSGEVNKGCAPSDIPSPKTVYQETYLCTERLCNSGNVVTTGFTLLSISLIASIIL